MKLVLDTSIVIALFASDEEQDHLLELIRGYDFVCSESIVPEMGNAISAMFKRRRITLQQGLALIDGFLKLDIQRVPLNLTRALEISQAYHLYAYDSYVLECAERLHLELITLDNRMNEVARQLGISILEV
jgi:predicted nucleic acid-binding protein